MWGLRFPGVGLGPRKRQCVGACGPGYHRSVIALERGAIMRGKEAAKSAQLRERTAEQRAASATDELAVMRARLRGAEDALRTSVAEAEGLRARVATLADERFAERDAEVERLHSELDALRGRLARALTMIGEIEQRGETVSTVDNGDLRELLGADLYAALCLPWAETRQMRRSMETRTPGWLSARQGAVDESLRRFQRDRATAE